MHKYILIYIFYVGVLSCGNSNISNEHLTEGLISVHKYFLNVESISQLPRPDNLEKKIWFKDSCIILEQKVVNINTNYGDSGVQRSESYDFYKYTFMDIRTLICQDYYYFSDSAVPICNYKLKKTDDNGWIFYAINKPIETLGKLSPIPDTLINNRLYKRIKITNE